MNKLSDLIITFVLITYAGFSHAYVGPGAGLSAIGSVLSFVVVILLLIIGLLWYPLKRIISWSKKTVENESETEISDEDTG